MWMPTAIEPGTGIGTGSPCARRSRARPPPPSLLEQAAELANQGRHAEAIAACEQHLRLKGPGAAAYYLMGMICQAAGDRRRAEDCFHKTIYLDPGMTRRCWPWRYLAERRGDRDAAAGFRRRARRTAAGPRTRTTVTGQPACNEDHGRKPTPRPEVSHDHDPHDDARRRPGKWPGAVRPR